MANFYFSLKFECLHTYVNTTYRPKNTNKPGPGRPGRGLTMKIREDPNAKY